MPVTNRGLSVVCGKRISHGFHQQKDFLAAVNSVETAGLTESTHEGRNHEGY